MDIVQVNASAWGDWDKMIDYIRQMASEGFKIEIINAIYLLEIFHGEELKELGFNVKYI